MKVQTAWQIRIILNLRPIIHRKRSKKLKNNAKNRRDKLRYSRMKVLKLWKNWKKSQMNTVNYNPRKFILKIIRRTQMILKKKFRNRESESKINLNLSPNLRWKSMKPELRFCRISWRNMKKWWENIPKLFKEKIRKILNSANKSKISQKWQMNWVWIRQNSIQSGLSPTPNVKMPQVPQPQVIPEIFPNHAQDEKS